MGTGVGEAFRKAGERNVREVLVGKQTEFQRVNEALAESCGDQNLGGHSLREVCENVVVERGASGEIV